MPGHVFFFSVLYSHQHWPFLSRAKMSVLMTRHARARFFLCFAATSIDLTSPFYPTLKMSFSYGIDDPPCLGTVLSVLGNWLALLPRAYAQAVKHCLSIVCRLHENHQIATSIGIWATRKCNETVDIGENCLQYASSCLVKSMSVTNIVLLVRGCNDPIFCTRFRNHLISRTDFLISDWFPDLLLISKWFLSGSWFLGWFLDFYCDFWIS